VGVPILGKSGRFQKTTLLAKCAGELYKVGWIRFASDGGLYAQFHQTEPVVARGEAIQSGGQLTPATEVDLAAVPEKHRVDVHLSLHPSGELHVRSGRNTPLVRWNIGSWLPPKAPSLLAHLFSPPISQLLTQSQPRPQDRVFSLADVDSGVRATITLLPKGLIPQRGVLMGISPRYNVAVEIGVVRPATPGIYLVKEFPSPSD